MRKNWLPAIVYVFFGITATQAGLLTDSVSKIIEKKQYLQQNIGVLIKDLSSDTTLVSINQTGLFNPASVMKILTALAASELLGQNYSFKTSVYQDGFFSKDSGIIHGHLYIKGGADPCFLVEKLWLFTQHLIHCGVRVIEKNVVLDDSFFDSLSFGPGFGQEKSSRAYEAPVSSLSANFNTILIHAAPSTTVGSAVLITPFPEVQNIFIKSTATTTKSNLSSGLDVRTDFAKGKTIVSVSGTLDINDEPRYIFRKISNPWEYFGQMLETFFKQSGIQVRGTFVHGLTPAAQRREKPLYVFIAGTLQEAMRNMFKYSSNFTAEMLFKTIAAEHDSGNGSWSGSADLIKTWWRSGEIKNISASLGDTSIPVVGNGSGMGDVNRVSPAHLAAVLTYAYTKKSFAPDFQNALSIAGIDGTIKSRFKKSFLKGILRAKTGTLIESGVCSLAGYVFFQEKTFIFVILINDPKHSYSSHLQLEETILEAVLAKEK